MSALCLCCAIFLCLLCSTLAGKGSKGLLVRKQEGDTMTFRCSTPLPDQEDLSVYMRLTKEILVLYFHQETRKITLHDKFKLRLTTKGRLEEMDITITNLTIEDSGAYWCVYSAYKTPKTEKTEGEGAVLLVVNDEECDQNNASSGLGMSWYLVLVSAVTAGSVLLLSLLILFIWVIPRCFHSHSREATVVRFDGQPINETDTPAQLEMEDEDTINVFQQQTGGLY